MRSSLARMGAALALLLSTPGVAGPPPAAVPPAAVPPAPAIPAGLLPAAPTRSPGSGCLASGDGYLRAQVAGAVDARIDWPNSGTRCQGESKTEPVGVRLSFQRESGGKPDLLFVFGLTGVRPGEAAHAVGTNLTVIVQGTSKIYGTQGDSRCTVDALSQRPLPAAGSYRVEARGFCVQPAHAIRGNGAVLVSTFEFAGVVDYEAAAGSAGSAGKSPAP